jgi:hypothetical protein
VAAPAAFVYDPSHEFGANPTPFVLMMVAGFVIGVAGHVHRLRAGGADPVPSRWSSVRRGRLRHPRGAGRPWPRPAGKP